MYHRVARLQVDPWQLNVTPEFFAEHMQVLKKRAHPVRLEEFSRNSAASVLRKNVAVTFDDGYADNFHNAKPVLERHEIPATFFIVSGAINAQAEFWWDELERLTLAAPTLPDQFALKLEGRDYQWPLSAEAPLKLIEAIPENGTALSPAGLHAVLYRLIDPLPFPEKKEVLTRIAGWAGLSAWPRPDYLPMTGRQLTEMADSPVCAIGAHTVTHPRLSRLAPAAQEIEIGQSKRDLEKILNREVTTFSYPHGDYSEITPGLVKASGFACSCTVQPAPVQRRGDAFQLPRFKVLNWPGDQFEFELTRWLKG